jgi:valyl-tRNA synthetase
LFFWVARMIMSGLEFTGEVPFHTVYLHGLIRDENGRKMSKTFGNVIDPLVVMDDLGTDALRFTLLVGSSPGNDTNLSLKKVEANRNFANKIWNAGRFVIAVISGQSTVGRSEDEEPGNWQLATGNWTLADSWIWARLQTLVRDVDRLFQSYQYGEAGRQIYEFFWGEFADWYVELAKLQLVEGGPRANSTAGTLARVMDICLRLLHPFTPFITEELWGHLRLALLESPLSSLAQDWPQALIVTSWPRPRPEEGWENARIAEFTLLQELVRAVRNLRAEKGVKPGRRIPATLVSASASGVLRLQAASIATLAGIDPQALTILESIPGKPQGHEALVIGPVEIYLPLAGLVDTGDERRRLEKELGEVSAQITRLETLLAGSFSEKAPPAVVQKEREKLWGYQETARKLRSQLSLIE